LKSHVAKTRYEDMEKIRVVSVREGARKNSRIGQQRSYLWSQILVEL